MVSVPENGLQMPGDSSAMVVDIAALQGSADLATDQVLQAGGVRARGALGTVPIVLPGQHAVHRRLPGHKRTLAAIGVCVQ